MKQEWSLVVDCLVIRGKYSVTAMEYCDGGWFVRKVKVPALVIYGNFCDYMESIGFGMKPK